VEDASPHFLELLGGQVKEVPAFEALGVDAIRDAGELDGRVAELVHEAGRVGLGRFEGARLDDDDDVLELPELPRVLVVADDVAGIAGEEVAARGTEGEGADGVGHPRHRKEQRDDSGHHPAPTREPHEAPQEPTRTRYADHPMATMGWAKCTIEVRSN